MCWWILFAFWSLGFVVSNSEFAQAVDYLRILKPCINCNAGHCPILPCRGVCYLYEHGIVPWVMLHKTKRLHVAQNLYFSSIDIEPQFAVIVWWSSFLSVSSVKPNSRASELRWNAQKCRSGCLFHQMQYIWYFSKRSRVMNHYTLRDCPLVATTLQPSSKWQWSR